MLATDELHDSDAMDPRGHAYLLLQNGVVTLHQNLARDVFREDLVTILTKAHCHHQLGHLKEENIMESVLANLRYSMPVEFQTSIFCGWCSKNYDRHRKQQGQTKCHSTTPFQWNSPLIHNGLHTWLATCNEPLYHLHPVMFFGILKRHTFL